MSPRTARRTRRSPRSSTTIPSRSKARGSTAWLKRMDICRTRLALSASMCSRATSRPSRMMATRSQSRSTSLRLWDERKMVRPAARSSRIRSMKMTSISGSRPTLGSSRTSRGASCIRAWTRPTFWRFPFDRCLIVRPKSRSSLSARASIRRGRTPPWSRAMNWRNSTTPMLSYSRRSPGMKARSRWTRSVPVQQSRPKIRAVPPFDRSSPSRTRMVRGLKRADVDTVLVDRHNYHLFTPLLYQVASSLLDPSEIARPARTMLRRIANVDVRVGSVTRVDLDTQQVQTENGPLEYDYLVLASGSINNFFGNDQLSQAAFGLKDLGQALALRNQVLWQFERASWSGDPQERRRLLTFVIVGGGPTGVEYAGALSELVALVLRKDFPYLDMAEVRVVLVELTDGLLAGFAPRLSKAAVRTLRRKGIELMLGVAAKDYTGGVLRLSNGQDLAVDTIVDRKSTR